MTSQSIPAGRGVYCNRTLNMRSIQAIGYDMDYTLIHYNVEEWEGRAYEHLKRKLLEEDGWPVEDLQFDPNMAMLGLVIDIERGNIVKANRFGYIKRAAHGTRPLDHRTMRAQYRRTLVDLREDRFRFLNTLFSISEACMYAQLVDLLDAGKLPDVHSPADLYRRTRAALDEAHMEGLLKAGIIAEPERYVDLDPETPLALLDQRNAGKKLMVITNSEWSYTEAMMSYAFDRFLPGSMTWRDLFEFVVVSSRKPIFFEARNPALRVAEDGTMTEHRGLLEPGGVYFGSNAQQVEQSLGVSGDRILYVGDHLFTDVNISKTLHHWRTALILRALEDEVVEIDAGQVRRADIQYMMQRKEEMEHRYSLMRLDVQRMEQGYGPHSDGDPLVIKAQMRQLREELIELDNQIAPLVVQESRAFNERWGLLTRTGNDKSHMTRQIERYADLYTSRVSNFLHATPFVYFRAPRGSVPHDLL